MNTEPDSGRKNYLPEEDTPVWQELTQDYNRRLSIPEERRTRGDQLFILSHNLRIAEAQTLGILEQAQSLPGWIPTNRLEIQATQLLRTIRDRRDIISLTALRYGPEAPLDLSEGYHEDHMNGSTHHTSQGWQGRT